MKNLFVRFVREEAGQDLIEYSLLAGLIAIAAVTVIGNIGDNVDRVFGLVDTELGKVTVTP